MDRIIIHNIESVLPTYAFNNHTLLNLPNTSTRNIELLHGFDLAKKEIVYESLGAGFGDSKTNQEVEQAAINCVTGHYKSRGWSVKSVESEKCGYDLLCTKDLQEEHVEVKGIQGEVVAFIITANEVKQSANENFVLCAVTSALSEEKRQPHWFRSKELKEQFTLEPISYNAVLRK